MRRYQRRSRIPVEHGVNIIQSQHTHGCSGLYSGAPDVRQQESVLECEISRMKLGFPFLDVQSGRCDLTTLKSNDEFFIHDKSTSGRVDDDRTGRKKLDRLGIQKMMSLFRLRRMEAQKRADAKQIQRVGMEYRISHSPFGYANGVVVMDLHAKASRTARNRLADVSHTEDAENFAGGLPSK